jgi:oligopeptide transport system substrate-binding protein
MKKIISLILVLTMILTACSGEKTEPSDTTPGTEVSAGDTEDITEGGKYAEEQVYKTVYSEELQTINYLSTATSVELALAANLVDTLVDYDKY